MIKRGLLLSLALLTAGCTEERPMDPVPKLDRGKTQFHKTLIDTESEYIYVPSTVEANRTSSQTRPHWMGEAKIVRLKFTENALKVVEVEEDGRFKANPVNETPVLTIPIEHVDYKCAEDTYGECTKKEEENEEVKWDQRREFRLKPDELAQQEVNTLPSELDNLFGGCHDETHSELVFSKVEDGAINIQLEKTFRTNIRCTDIFSIRSFEELLDKTSFTVRHHFSLVRIKDIESPGYNPAKYTRADESNFGFFSTRKHKLNDNHRETLDSESYLFNRWNKDKKEIVYYLNEPFNKPENQAIKEATIAAVNAVNRGLSQAEAGFQITIKEPVPGMQSADLRNNMIVMVEDPTAAGVIGYGPSVAHPRTGEILQARSVMYLGTIKKFIQFTYDDLIAERLKELQLLKAGEKAGAEPEAQPELSESLEQNYERVASSDSMNSQDLRAQSRLLKGSSPWTSPVDLTQLKKLAVVPQANQTENEFSKRVQDLIDKNNHLNKRVDFWSRHNGYSGELFNFHAAIVDQVDEVMEEMGMKPWDRLTVQEQKRVTDKLLPFVWIPTLIHELGHNLGLRHNFAGSEDSENFYSEEELHEMGVDHKFEYSSIMDYTYRSDNELQIMGKYDIAALRYGYAEKVELEDGQMVSLSEFREQPSAKMKAYQFCTDEHVGANPNCNPFDEGTNILEIAQHMIKAYEEGYSRNNFRNNRLVFSSMDEAHQIARVNRTFQSLRLIFERYESIKNDFNLPATDPIWEEVPFLKELKQATVITGRFFLDVLKTPDVHCAVSMAENPSQIVGVVPIRVLSQRAISCFDQDNIQLNESYVIVGEGGKSFDTRKSPANRDPSADQVDVRGIWMDKLLAAHYLFTRELGSSLFDKYTENFLHMPELQAEISDSIAQLLKDELRAPVEFRTIHGGAATLEMGYKLADAQDKMNSHKIHNIMDPRALMMLGLPHDTTTFHRELLHRIVSATDSRIHARVNQPFLNQLKVYTDVPNNGRPLDEYVAVEVLGVDYLAPQESTYSVSLIENLKMVRTLESLGNDKIKEIVAGLENGEDMSADAKDGETKARGYGLEALNKYLAGSYQSSAYYESIVQNLAEL